jgi:hypothetical protein
MHGDSDPKFPNFPFVRFWPQIQSKNKMANINESDPLLHRWSRQEDSSARRKRPAFVLACLLLVSGGLYMAVAAFQGRFSGSSATSSSGSVMNERDIDISLEGASYRSASAAKAPRYYATQFISFTINTLGGLAARGECDQGQDVDENGVCYLGNVNITQDMEHRTLLVKAILNGLKENIKEKHPKIDHRDGVLKILAMPEFFWRGPYGACEYWTDYASCSVVFRQECRITHTLFLHSAQILPSSSMAMICTVV